MLAIRFLSSVFLLAAVVAFVSEVTRAQLGIPLAPFTPLLKQLSDGAPAIVAAVQRGLPHLVWDPVLKSLLWLPLWALLGVIGVVLAWLGRQRRRINIFTN
jgi:hypothetical protein